MKVFFKTKTREREQAGPSTGEKEKEKEPDAPQARLAALLQAAGPQRGILTTRADAPRDVLAKDGPYSLSAQPITELYANRMVDVVSNWDTYAGPTERLRACGKILGDVFIACGMPPLKTELSTVGENAAAHLDSSRWTIVIDPQCLEIGPSGIDDSNRRRALFAINTFYHEARHGEQFFQIGRALRHHGKEYVQKNIGLLGIVAKAACSRVERDDDPLAQDVKVWYESIFGSQSFLRESKLQKFHLKRLDRDFNPLSQSASSGLKAHESLPEEEDAFAVAGIATTFVSELLRLKGRD